MYCNFPEGFSSLVYSRAQLKVHVYCIHVNLAS